MSKPDGLEFKDVTFEVKADAATGTFSGFASTNDLDRGDDVVLPGAFQKSIASGKPIAMLWQHDARQPLGVFTKLEEQDGKLYVEGKISQTTLGKDVSILLKDRAVWAMSIGYDPIDSEYNNEGIRLLKELDLWEISIVTFPMNQNAVVIDAKGVNVRSIERALREAGYSVSQSKAIACAGIKVLREVEQPPNIPYWDELKAAINDISKG